MQRWSTPQWDAPDPPSWGGIGDYLLACAEREVRTQGSVRPLLVAHAGDRTRVAVRVRRAAADEHVEPLVEAAALVVAAGCDRAALCVSGRVWSFDDPIPPVCADGDLRQRAVVLHFAESIGRPWSVLRPWAPGAHGCPEWGAAQRMHGGQGWIPALMALCVSPAQGPGERLGELPGLARTVLRLSAVGHGVLLAEEPG